MIAATENQPQGTHWGRVWLLFLAGSTSACHIGKIPAALPALRLEYELGLFASSWIVSLFSLLIAAFGLVVGVLTSRINARLAAVCGLFVAGIASLLGSFTESVSLLILTRCGEGAGWLVAAISVPVLMRGMAAPSDRALVLGIWGAFMPVGISLSLVLSPWLMDIIGWRGLWLTIGSFTLVASAVVAIASGPHVPRPGVSGSSVSGSRAAAYRAHPGLASSTPQNLNLRDALAIGLARSPLLMAGCFLIYSAQFLSLTTFFPTLVVSVHAVPLATAAAMGAAVVGVNAVGNVAAGWLLSRGVAYRRILGVSLVVMSITASVTYLDDTPLIVRWLSAAVFSAFGGLVPGTLFALAPQVVTNPLHMVIINGLIMQAAGVGQLSGPPLVSYMVDTLERWSGAIGVTAVLLLAGLWIVSKMRHVPSDAGHRNR